MHIKITSLLGFSFLILVLVFVREGFECLKDLIFPVSQMVVPVT